MSETNRQIGQSSSKNGTNKNPGKVAKKSGIKDLGWLDSTPTETSSDLALSLNQINENKLESMASAIVQGRQKSIVQFADLLETVASGQLDSLLLQKEIEDRQVMRQDKFIFEIPESDDFTLENVLEKHCGIPPAEQKRLGGNLNARSLRQLPPSP